MEKAVPVLSGVNFKDSFFFFFTNEGNPWLNVCFLGTTVCYNMFPGSRTAG